MFETIGNLRWPKVIKPEVQPDESSCGVVATRLLLLSVGINIPIDELIGILGNTYWGTEISSIERLFRAPFVNNRVKYSRDNTTRDLYSVLARKKLVMIDYQANWACGEDQAKLNAGHYCVVYAASRGKIQTFDPGCKGGLYAFPARNLKRLWVDTNINGAPIVRGWMAVAG